MQGILISWLAAVTKELGEMFMSSLALRHLELEVVFFSELALALFPEPVVVF